MSTPLLLLANALIPNRRRRRYYFDQTAARILDLDSGPVDAPPIDLAAAIGVSAESFAAIRSGLTAPPRFVEQLARLAYKVPPPKFIDIYGPAILAANAIAAVVMIALLG